uniref:plasmalemma vesicle associated protein a isoform X2 n=1 Tax=Semicossyphus pulcher TaxID=241346 RepID=UPI0037E760BA
MYSSKYSQVSKYSPEARKKMPYRSKGKSCGYYMRIVFFFSSLIQSLIIVSLVLFLIYGKDQDSASTSRIHDLEESFSRLSIDNMALRQQRKNLTNLLNTTLIQKARNDWDLAMFRHASNISAILIQDMEKRLTQCSGELVMCRLSHYQCPTPSQPNTCGLLTERLKARLQLVESNFTQTSQRMRMEMEQITKERDNMNLEAIRLRREQSTHEKQVEFFKLKCKDDFTQSLSGVSSVSTAFLEKINSLFPSHIAFQLTCPKQREHLEQIRTNCSSLSREVEDRFQRYLNSVGDQVSTIQSESSRLKAENWRLSEDFRWCSQNRTALIQQHKLSQDKLQLKHDQDKENLLMEKIKLHGKLEVLENNVNYKTKEVEHLVEQIKHLNMTCMTKAGFGGAIPFGSGPLGGGGSSPPFFSPFGAGQPNKPGSGSSSFGSVFNKPTSTGTGSSLFSSGSSGSTGFGSNKPGSGSSNPSLFSSGSSGSTGFGSNKPGSTGTGSSSTSLFSSGSSGSTGFGSNKPGSTGTGSSLFSSGSSGSTGFGSNKPGSGSSSSSLFSSGSSGSTGLGSNKPGSTGTGSSLFSSGSSGSTGLGSNKPGSTGTGSSLFSSGSSGSTGLGLNKPGSTGTGSSLFSSGSSSSTGLGSNKPGSTGIGSSSSSLFSSGSSSSTGLGSNKPGSSFGSAGSSPSLSSSGRGSSSFGSTGSSPNLSSGGLGLNKPSTSSGKSSSGFGSSASGSSGSTGSTGKSSSGLGWFGFGSSSSGQNKPGSVTGKGPSSGTGLSFGGGRTSGQGDGPVSVAQHLQYLQRLINPPGPEEKQDLSRMLG